MQQSWLQNSACHLSNLFILCPEPGGTSHVEVFNSCPSVSQSVGRLVDWLIGSSVQGLFKNSIVVSSQSLKACAWDDGLGIEYFWDTFRILLALFWVTFRVIFGYFLDTFWILLGYFWDTFGILLG